MLFLVREPILKFLDSRIMSWFNRDISFMIELGVNNSVAPPLTIPNREVKCAYADGTASAGE